MVLVPLVHEQFPDFFPEDNEALHLGVILDHQSCTAMQERAEMHDLLHQTNE